VLISGSSGMMLMALRTSLMGYSVVF